MIFTPTVSNQLGPYLLGTILSSIIYGITCIQVYIYYRYNQRDSKALKITIGVLWVLDTLHQLFSIIAVYDLAVTNFGNEAALGFPPWSNMASIPPFALVEIIVKMIYVVRIWRSSGKNWYLVTPIIILSFIEFFAVFIFCIWGLVIDTFEGFAKLGPFSYVGLGCSALADVLIAATQVSVLWKMRNGFRRTESIARTLMLYVINTQLLTSVFAILDILTFAFLQGTLIYTLFFNVLAKLLLSCCLAMLNARRELRENMNTGDMLSIPLGTSGSRTAFGQPSALRSGGTQDACKGMTIQISKSTDVKFDSFSAIDVEARAVDAQFPDDKN
ncbi:hypothetical protein OBBRIDRAFT_890908 [Obba rivulosa]|uniref:DUF6534 domain-containing protein n=1 Tax=Obba rivulosa TaxID=1052685 RepID=A0A8E2AP76_9APHY|nr:hypothetical protein OBBRIDRAFT_890908 [Obba rivulosa]